MTIRAPILCVMGSLVFFAMPEAAHSDFSGGKALYARRCVPCHVRKKIEFDPAAYGQRGLWSETARMAPLARLGYDEQLAVASYLEAVRNGRETLPPNDPLMGKRKAAATVSTNDFAQAQELFRTRCANCHAHKLEPIHPEKYTEGKLKNCVQRMATLARLSSEQTQQVARYLEAVRAKKNDPSAPVSST